MNRAKWVRLAAWSMVALVSLLGSILLVKRFIHPTHYSQMVVAYIEKRLHRRVTFSSAAITVWPGLGLRLADLEVSKNPPEAGNPFLAMKGLRVQVALRPLLQRRIVLSRIVLERPVMAAVRDREGRLSFADLLGEVESPAPSSGPPSGVAPSLFVAKTVIRDGDLTFIDDSPREGRTITKVSNLDLEVERLGYAEPLHLKFRSRSQAYGGRWEASGSATLDGGPSFALIVMAHGVDVERLTDAFGQDRRSKDISSKRGMTGLLDVQARLHGRGTEIRAWEKTLVGSGSVTLRNGRMPSSNIMEAVIRSLLGLFGRIIPMRQNMTLSEPVTIERFDQLFTVRDGRVLTENIHLVTSDYVLSGAGSFGLDNTLDYNTVVHFTATGTQKMITMVSLPVLDQTFKTLPPIPVRVTGTFESPRIRPDVSVIPAGKVPGLSGGAEAIKGGIGSGARGIRSGLGRLLGRHPESERKK